MLKWNFYPFFALLQRIAVYMSERKKETQKGGKKENSMVHCNNIGACMVTIGEIISILVF
jgi:hypothetical protein